MYIDYYPEYRDAVVELIGDLNNMYNLPRDYPASKRVQDIACLIVSSEKHDWRQELRWVKRLVTTNRFYFYLAGCTEEALELWYLLVEYHELIGPEWDGTKWVTPSDAK